MIRPALLIVWPSHIDYPLFRYYLKKERERFSNIYICFSTYSGSEDYRNFIMYDLRFCKFTSRLDKEADWRNDAVKTLLSLPLSSDYFVFMEQDFLISSDYFWNSILSTKSEFIYYKEGERIHPAFCMVSRNLVDKTSVDFSAYPDVGFDHFGKFFAEVSKIEEGVNIMAFGFKPKIDFYHLGGLTQNYHCFKNDQPLYKPKEFLYYNFKSMLLPHQNMPFYKKMLEINEKYKYEEERNHFLNKFFPGDKEV